MTKDMFITEVIRGLQSNDKVKTVVHIPLSNLIVELHNGEKFSMTIGKMRKR